MEDQEVIEVHGDDKPMRFTYPDIAETAGVFRCVALGILNLRKRIGYLVHAAPGNRLALEALIDSALSEVKKPSNLRVGVAGNIPPSRFERKEVSDADFQNEQLDMEQHAQWIIAMLRSKKILLENIDNRLSSKPATGDYRMRVDTVEQEIVIQYEENEFDKDDE